MKILLFRIKFPLQHVSHFQHTVSVYKGQYALASLNKYGEGKFSFHMLSNEDSPQNTLVDLNLLL